MDAEKKGKLVKVLLLIVVVTFILSMPTYVSALPSSKNAVKITEKTASVDIGVYRDRACKQDLAFIDWGTVYPSSTVNFPVYIQNLGTVQATLQMTALNWEPLNSSEYLSLSWDYSGQPIKPNGVIPVTFKLIVSENAKNLGAFSFNINIISYG